jgi:O-antigen polymerase
MAFASAIAIFLITQSRSGFIGFICGITYAIYQNRGTKAFNKKFIGAGVAIILFAFISLLFYKPKSSQGRKLIYQVSFNMLFDNWKTGVGIGKFKAVYNEYQANYFIANDIDSKTALLADNTYYAFNDYLQWVIETGFIGLAILLVFFFLLWKRIKQLNNANNNKPVIVAATSGLICIGVASLFSYPMQVWPVQSLALIFTAILLFHPQKSKEATIQRILIFISRSLNICLFGVLIASTITLYQRKGLEKNAQNLSMLGYKKLATEEYRKLSDQYPSTGYNRLNYTQHLYHANKLKEALVQVKETKGYYINNEVYSLQAKIENELGLFSEAEKSYLRAIYMVPNRMGSRFDLINFYLSQKDTANARKWANSILNMPIKVPSERTDYMLKATRDELKKLKQL